MIKVQIGNSIYEIPEVGNSLWGEKTTEVLLAMTDALSNVVGPEDILTKEALLSNNVTTPTDINGFRFNTSIIEQCVASGVVVRTFPQELQIEPRKDAFVVEASNYNGSFDYSVRYIGDGAGIKLFATESGQFQYTSEDVEFTSSIFIKFRGSAIVSDDEV